MNWAVGHFERFLHCLPRDKRALVGLLLLLLVGSQTSILAEPPVALPADAHARQLVPFLKSHCLECHTGEDSKSGIALEPLLDEANFQDHRKLWEAALKQLRAGAMPPEEAPRPEPARLAEVVAWIDSELHSVDCEAPRDPGQVTLRRLNRQEYGNTIRDLLGVEFEPAESFPVDDLGHGFDNNGDALTMSPLLMEKYFEAAATIAAKTLPVEEEMELPRKSFDSDDLAGGDGRGGSRVLTTNGEMSTTWTNDRAGRYRLRIKASATRAGDEPARMGVNINGRVVTEFEVVAPRDAPEWYTVRLQLSEEEKRLGLTFANDFYDPENADPSKRDRNLYVSEVELLGPIIEPDKPTLFQQSIANELPRLTRHPLNGAHRDQLTRVSRNIMQSLLLRAFRRPPTEDEIARHVRYLLAGVERGESYELALRQTLQVVLVSPKFLFRGEVPANSLPSNAIKDGLVPIDEFAIASRLSYFLWSSMPDETLRKLAAEKKLRSSLPYQIERMLADDKSWALVENFAGQWLDTRQVAGMIPDPKLFPDYNEELAASMRGETLHFFSGVLHEQRPLIELIAADYTWLDERLARHYGIDGVKGDHFRKVALKDRVRGGVLTQASMLTLTSNPTRTSPVKRGKWILEQILDDAPPPPPANVPELDDSADELTGTLRQRLEQHRSNQVCASCHSTMDPLGFALENFDSVGRWREKEGSLRIDAAGELPDGTRFVGPVGLKQLLAGRKDEFREALSRRLLTYALGRGLEYYDACAVEEICRQTERDDDTLAAMILAITRSEPFQNRRAVVREGEGAKR